ncbi:hypothetical protein [Flavobacterium sp.]|uniref:hypothetical protein n=1 Tax=Flavobacterium sp. TaxID=239 RepID=UPI00286DD79A|nr:hypothetical protein [Flavobacterium sp.]
MEDLKKIALENIRNFIKVTPRNEILSRLEILSREGSIDGYLISSIINDEFINLCNKNLPIEEMVAVKVHWPDIAYFFQNNINNPQN